MLAGQRTGRGIEGCARCERELDATAFMQVSSWFVRCVRMRISMSACVIVSVSMCVLFHEHTMHAYLA